MRLSAGCKDAVTFEIEFCSGRESLVLVASLAVYVVRGIALAILAPFVVIMRHSIYGAFIMTPFYVFEHFSLTLCC